MVISNVACPSNAMVFEARSTNTRSRRPAPLLAPPHISTGSGSSMRVMAKLQVGNTWELGLLPYIPVPHLVGAKTCTVRVAGISGAMESWTLGGYPSLNWLVARSLFTTPVCPTLIGSAFDR